MTAEQRDGRVDDADGADAEQSGGSGETPRRRRREVPEGSRRHRMRTHRVIGPFYKIVVLVIGLALIAAGLAMLVLPGPGWVVIILGLAVLAPEFEWADRLLEPVERFAKAAAERALDPRKRRQNLILLLVTIVFVAVVAGLYLWRYGFTYEPLPFF